MFPLWKQYKHIYIYIYKNRYTHVYAYTFRNICIYICIFLNVCIYVYIYIAVSHVTHIRHNLIRISLSIYVYAYIRVLYIYIYILFIYIYIYSARHVHSSLWTKGMHAYQWTLLLLRVTSILFACQCNLCLIYHTYRHT